MIKRTVLAPDLSGKQAADPDLTAIAGLTPTDDDILQRKAGAWTNRTLAQLLADLGLGLPGSVFTTGYSYGPQTGTPSSSAATAGQLHAYPLIINRASQAFDRIGINVNTGATGSTVRLGIYADSGGLPGALLVDAGTVDTATAGDKVLTIAQTLSRGRYWVAAVAQGGAPTLGTVTGVSPYVGKPTVSGSGHTAAYHVTGVTGALPGSFGAPADTNFALRAILRAA